MRNYIKLITATAFTVLLSNSTQAQSQISFFHLGDYVQQSTEVSPVYIPKNSFSLGLPGMSGISLSISNGFSYADLLTQDSNDINNVDLNYLNAIDQFEGDYNNLTINQTVSILNLAFKRKHGSLSFFINEKLNINWEMNKKGALSIFNDALRTPGNNIILDDNINAIAYIESGIGFTQQFLNDKLAIGVKAKYLIGAYNGSTEENGIAQIDINSDRSLNINTSNATARTSGITDFNNFDDISFSTGNSGIGFDIGASYEIIPNLVVEAAINDIGSITWNDNVTEYYLEDVTDLKHDGIDFNSDDDFIDDLESILDDPSKLASGEREGESYKTSLATNSYFSASYKLARIHQFRATIFNEHVHNSEESVIGLGYNIALKRTTYGVVGIKNAYGDIDLGLNLATKLGPLQLYLASDNLNTVLGNLKSPEKIKGANIRFGINFVFGYNKWLDKEEI